MNNDDIYCLSDFFTDSPNNDSQDTNNSNIMSDKAYS